MFDAMRLIEKLPEMLSGEELIQKMSILPVYEEEVCRNGSDAERLMKLSDLYNIYPRCPQKSTVNCIWQFCVLYRKKEQSWRYSR